MKLLLYCTKNKPYLYSMNTVYDGKQLFDIVKGNKEMVEEKMNNLFCMNNLRKLNGKIVAECDYDIEPIIIDEPSMCDNYDWLLEGSCLTMNELKKYLNNNNGYAIHIKNLNIFERTRGLREYKNAKKVKTTSNNMTYPICWYCNLFGNGCIQCYLTKAPQNMMYAYNDSGNKYVLISIHPEWLCKILNGEKTIEVRKKVLKEMLK